MRLKKYNKKYLSAVNDDLLKFIVTFLDNHTILNVLTTSYDINRRLCSNGQNVKKKVKREGENGEKEYRNLFTSISIQPTDDISDAIRHYLNHSKSIQRTVLYRMVDPEILWPFTTKEMVYVNCVFSNGQKYQEHENIENLKENEINERRITYRNY